MSHVAEDEVATAKAHSVTTVAVVDDETAAAKARSAVADTKAAAKRLLSAEADASRKVLAER